MTQNTFPAIEIDGSGQPFIRFENVRITISKRPADKDWEGVDRYLTIRAYRDNTTNHVLMGPDIPIRNDRSDADILMAAYMMLKLTVA